jgi:outer membrane protein assembly factor BamB
MPNGFKPGFFILLSVFIFPDYAYAQEKSLVQKIAAASLPGNGLQQHDFLYTGEWDYRKPVQTIYLVRGGKVIWTYEVPFKDSTGAMAELGDATMRINGNIVFCRKTGAGEVTPDKKLIWNYDAPTGTEIHSVEPLGINKILMVVNGVPARVKIINIKSNKTENEFTLPTGKPGPHLQFRRVRITNTGTIVAAHLDSNLVAEYDMTGKKIWSVNIEKPWSAIRLKNGNTLITSYGSHIKEVNAKGEVVWELNQNDLPQINLYNIQVAVRRENGNTVFSNWCNNGIKKTEDWPGSVQLLEVSPDKKLVWALSQWHDPDLGPASSIQLLDEPSIKKSKGYLKKYIK